MFYGRYIHIIDMCTHQIWVYQLQKYLRVLDGDTITVFMENVPRLLERETFVSFALAKMRWGLSAVSFLFYMIKECAVRTVNPFSHILNSLTPKSLPLRMERFLDIRDVLH